jgi:hypothetical protein
MVGIDHMIVQSGEPHSPIADASGGSPQLAFRGFAMKSGMTVDVPSRDLDGVTLVQ